MKVWGIPLTTLESISKHNHLMFSTLFPLFSSVLIVLFVLVFSIRFLRFCSNSCLLFCRSFVLEGQTLEGSQLYRILCVELCALLRGEVVLPVPNLSLCHTRKIQHKPDSDKSD